MDELVQLRNARYKAAHERNAAVLYGSVCTESNLTDLQKLWLAQVIDVGPGPPVAPPPPLCHYGTSTVESPVGSPAPLCHSSTSTSSSPDGLPPPLPLCLCHSNPSTVESPVGSPPPLCHYGTSPVPDGLPPPLPLCHSSPSSSPVESPVGSPRLRTYFRPPTAAVMPIPVFMEVKNFDVEDQLTQPLQDATARQMEVETQSSQPSRRSLSCTLMCRRCRQCCRQCFRRCCGQCIRSIQLVCRSINMCCLVHLLVSAASSPLVRYLLHH